MAIAITVNRRDNSFRISEGGGLTGNLRILYNGDELYDNHGGATNDIVAGAEFAFPIPLDSTGKIPLGKYRFIFEDTAGSPTHDDDEIDFQISDLAAKMGITLNLAAPLLRVDDDTVYTIANGTISSASRTLTMQYPAGSGQQNVTATKSNITSDLYISTSILFTGVTQMMLETALTYAIAAVGTTQDTDADPTTSTTTVRAGFTYVAAPYGQKYSPQLNDNSLEYLYDMLSYQYNKVEVARVNKRTSYETLKSDYAYVAALVQQYTTALYTSQSSDLSTLITEIERATGYEVETTTEGTEAPARIYGIGSANQAETVLAVTRTISAADFVTLDSAPVKILDTDAGYFYTPLGATIACLTAPTTPTGSPVLKFHNGSSYDVNKALLTCTVPSGMVTAGDTANFEQVSGNEILQNASHIYLGAASSAVSDWDGDFLVTLYYGKTKA